MDSESLAKPESILQPVEHDRRTLLPWELAARELNIFVQVIRGDLSATMVPGLLFSLAAWKSAGADTSQLLTVLGKSVLYFAFFAFTFCLSNQIVGVEEDRLNKPHRPLPRGLITERGAWTRWGLSMVAYSTIAWQLGVLQWALVWQVVTCVHNLADGARNWLIKNLSNGVGVYAMLHAAWEFTTPVTEREWMWILFLSVVVSVLVPLQDLRDLEGDKLSGRKTFPMVFGFEPTRRFLGIGFLLLAPATHFLLRRLGEFSPAIWVCDVMLGIVSVAISILILIPHAAENRAHAPYKELKHRYYLHHTYLMFTYWYCVALLSAFFVLPKLS